MSIRWQRRDQRHQLEGYYLRRMHEIMNELIYVANCARPVTTSFCRTLRSIAVLSCETHVPPDMDTYNPHYTPPDQRYVAFFDKHRYKHASQLVST